MARSGQVARSAQGGPQVTALDTQAMTLGSDGEPMALGYANEPAGAPPPAYGRASCFGPMPSAPGQISTATRMPLPLTAISAALSRAMDAHVTASWRLGVATGASFSDISVDARRPDRLRPDRQRGKAASPGRSETRYLTPSFFCRLDDEVVYWKTSFLSG